MTSLKKGDYEPDSGSPFLRGLGGSGVLIPTAGLFKNPPNENRIINRIINCLYDANSYSYERSSG